MKKIKLFLICLFLIPLSFSVKSQDTLENYYSIKARLNHYYDSLYIVRNGDLKGTGYVQFQRWVKYFDPIMYPHGDFNIYNQSLHDYYSDFKNNSEVVNGYEVNWTSVGPNKKPAGNNVGGTGQVHYIYIDPTDNTNQKMFACAPVGGLFRSTDGGNNWYNCGTDYGLPICGVNSVAIDVANSNNTWFISTGNGEGYSAETGMNFHESIGIYRTTNAGANWECIGFSSNHGYGTRIRKLISVGSGTNLRLYAVVDDGPSNSNGGLMECPNPFDQTPIWTKRIPGDFYDLTCKPNDNNTIYVSGSYKESAHLYVYNTGNYSYIQILDPVFIVPYNKIRRVSIQTTPVAPDYVFTIFFTGDNNAKLCIYNILTNTWVDKGMFPYQIYEGGCNANASRGKGWAVSPVLNSENKFTIVFCNTDKVYSANISFDNNPCDWQPSTSGYCGEVHADKHCMTYTPDGEYLWIGTDGGVYKNNKYLLPAGWAEKNDGLSIGQVWDMACTEKNPNILISGGFDNGSNRYNKNPNGTWDVTHVWDGDGLQCIFDPINPDIMYVSHQSGGVAKSTNGGASFNGAAFIGHWRTNYTIHPTNGNILYGAGPDGMYRTTNRGENWALYSNFSEPNNSIYSLAVSKADPNFIYVRWINDWNVRERLYLSTNGGGTNSTDWVNLGNPPTMQEPPYYNLSINYILPDENDPYVVYISTGSVWGWSNDKYKIFKVNIDPQNPQNVVWTDISEGIPYYYSTNVIAQLKGSNYFFLSSNFGIMCKDMSDIHSDWINISGNLPNTFLSDIELDATNNLIYAGTMGRGIWEGNLPCFYNPTPIEITSNEIWNTEKRLSSDVVINAGATLTITSIAKFPTDAKIIIKKSGKLIVDGGTLTNACNGGRWGGVEVQGTSKWPQTLQYQGMVEFKNLAHMENSTKGIYAATILANGREDINGYGGIVQVDNSHFYNNYSSVTLSEFGNAQIPSASFVMNSTLEVDKDYYGDVDVYPGIINLREMYGVKIKNNYFKNTCPTAYYYNKNNGINSNDSKFDVYNNNYFIGLQYGIKALNTDLQYAPLIKNSVFTNCWRGIYLGGVSNAEVLNNYFNYKSQSTDPNSKAYGIYLDNCNNFHIEGNLLDASDVNFMPENGIVVNNSGVQNNKIYRNTFSQIKVPLNAQNINRSESGLNGLQILCNNITNCATNDIVLTQDMIEANTGIRRDQGKYTDPAIPAGNLFTKGALTYKNYINTSGNLIYYAHYSNDLISYLGYEHYLKPKIYSINSFISNQVTPILWNDYNWVNTDCPNTISNDGDGKGLPEIEVLKEQIGVWQTKIDSAQDVLTRKMDNGNTQQLVNRINTCGNSGYQNLYNDLRNYSPYLSEELLLAVIHKQGFPANMLLNLMLVNTHVAKDNFLMEALQQVQPPLSGGQMKQVKSKINVFSVMETDRIKLSALVLERDNAYNTVESFYVHDSIASSNDSLGVMLQKDPRISAKYQLVYHYLAKEDSANANQLLDQIPQWYMLNEYEQNEYVKYRQLFELKKQLLREGKKYKDMSEQQQQLLISAINNPSWSLSEINDLNALRQVEEIVVGKAGMVGGKITLLNYKEPILEPVEDKGKNLDNTETLEGDDIVIEEMLDKVLMEQNSIQLYPNPTSDEVNVLFNIAGNANKVMLQITDITGRSIETYPIDKNNNSYKINTQAFKKGIYYVILIVDGKNQKIEKLVIQ